MKRAYIAIGFMVILAPFFVWAAEYVNYSEPLENAAEETGAHEHEESLFKGIFSEYSIPGIGTSASTLVSGVIGCAIILVATIILRKAKHG